MKFLLLYATREGQTEKVAERLAAHLTELGHEVALRNAAGPKGDSAPGPEPFDRLVFGASMHAGGLEKELRSYLTEHAEQIRERPRALFVVLLSAATEAADARATALADARRKVDAQLAVPFDDVEFIAGALRYSRYPRPLRWLMRRIAAQAGTITTTDRDYEFTDFSRVAIRVEEGRLKRGNDHVRPLANYGRERPVRRRAAASVDAGGSGGLHPLRRHRR